MGNLTINNPHWRWNDPGGCHEEVAVDIFFSTTYGAGGDSFLGTYASGTVVDAIMPGMGQDINKVVSFQAELLRTQATGALTSDGTNMADGETVTLGGNTWDSPQVVYTFKTTLGGSGTSVLFPNQILIGASASASLSNLKAAINGETGYGTTYNSWTKKCPDMSGSVSGNVLTLTSRLLGARGNVVVTTETGAHMSFGAATLTGGGTDGRSVQLERHTQKLSIWNGTTENATADVHLKGVRCQFRYIRDPAAGLFYN